MVTISLVKDKEPYRDAIEQLIDEHREDFIPYGRYIDPDMDGNVDPEYFSNYRKPEEEMLVAERGSDLIGFMCIHRHCHREDYPPSPPYTLISLTLVDSDHRGKGLATRLNRQVVEMHDAGEFHDTMVRGTWESNEAQRHLYEKFGFEVIDRKKNHRANGDDTVYYVRRR